MVSESSPQLVNGIIVNHTHRRTEGNALPRYFEFRDILRRLFYSVKDKKE